MNSLDKIEFKNKLKIKNILTKDNSDAIDGKTLKPFRRIARYMFGPSEFIDKNLIFAHLDFEPFASLIANKKTFTVISGKNPSGSLHLGHLATFKLLLSLQKLGGEVIIPLTSDESFVDGKVKSIIEAEDIAKNIIIPQLIACGFDLEKTKIMIQSQYPDIYRLSCYFGKFVSTKKLKSVFGEDSLQNISQTFYRGAVQLSTILMPQLEDFGGTKNVLVPVSKDQHPYILLARDVAKSVNLIPPSEIVIPFLQSLKSPFEKMSSSKPESCIYLDDSKEEIIRKIKTAYTGSVSSLEGHKKFGGIPEIDSCFQILRFHHLDNNFVKLIYKKYKLGKITASELKNITIEFVIDLTGKIQEKVKKVSDEEINKIIFSKRISSI